MPPVGPVGLSAQPSSCQRTRSASAAAVNPCAWCQVRSWRSPCSVSTRTRQVVITIPRAGHLGLEVVGQVLGREHHRPALEHRGLEGQVDGQLGWRRAGAGGTVVEAGRGLVGAEAVRAEATQDVGGGQGRQLRQGPQAEAVEHARPGPGPPAPRRPAPSPGRGRGRPPRHRRARPAIPAHPAGPGPRRRERPGWRRTGRPPPPPPEGRWPAPGRRGPRSRPRPPSAAKASSPPW